MARRGKSERDERLGKALRDNLRRRKALRADGGKKADKAEERPPPTPGGDAKRPA